MAAMGTPFSYPSPLAATAATIVLPALALAACSSDGERSSTADQASSSAASASAASGTGAADADSADSAADGKVERLTATVLETLPFDATSFTQGLEVTPAGQLLVGTGQFGQSRVYLADPSTGKQTTSVDLPAEFFGEGLTQVGDSIWELTWKAGQAIKRDAVTLEETGRAPYEGEGWGLCALESGSGGELIMSDGSAQLRHLDPVTFDETGERTTVTLNGQPVTEINELECVNDASTDHHPTVYANVWFTTDILRIDPATGEVTGIIDASAAQNNADADENNVLNGIAHIPGTDEFYITGKRWPDLYRVTFDPAQ